MAFAELALAFAVFALARGVRAGRHVDEPLPSPLAGSEFVQARASLMQRARHAEAAGDVLRADLHRDLCRRLRLPAESDVGRVVEAAGGRGLDPELVRRALLAGTPTDADLRDLAAAHAQVRAALERATATVPVTDSTVVHDAPSEGALR